MGCANSKVENEEGVARCHQRKRLMKQAVSSRHVFAASHAQYMVSLKGVGSAFRQFAEGEVKEGDSHMYRPETPTTPATPATTSPLALAPPPPPMLPPPPPMSPGLSPMRSPSPLPPSPPRLDLPRHDRLQMGSPLARTVSSPENYSMEHHLPPPPPGITVRQYRMEHTPPIIPSKIYRFEDSPPSYLPKSYRLEESPPPPPLITPIQMDDDWRYTSHALPPPSSLRENNPPPPPPVMRSSWQDLFLDPFRPAPPSFNYMEQMRNDEMGQRRSQEMDQRRSQEMEKRRSEEIEQQRRSQEMELRRSEEMEQQRRLQEMEQQRRNQEMEQQRRNQEMEQQRRNQEIEMRNKEMETRRMQERSIPEKPREQSPERLPEKFEERKHVSELRHAPEIESKKMEHLDEEDIPDLEDVDDIPDDIDGTPPKDYDDEKDNRVIMVEPETPPKVQPEPPKPIKVPKPGKPPKAEQKDEGLLKVNKELAIVMPQKGGRDLLDVLKEVDDCFLRAAQSGESVSRMLETKKAHYHSSFSDSLRGVGESARHFNTNFWKLSAKSGSPHGHMRTGSNADILSDETASITSLRSLSSLSSAAWTEECGMTGSHASTLDRLLAWEKKLYLEVKEAEALRIELERKYALYRNQDAKGDDQITIDKTRAIIKGLQTKMVVAIHAVDGAATAVQKLRDEELYPQLLELLEGMGDMWRKLSACHQAQLRAVEAMKRLDNSAACEPTTSSHRHSTTQLESALNKWGDSLNRVVNSQRDYLKHLTAWLKLSLMQFGSDEMERNGSRSPSRSPRSPLHANHGPSPIYGLCQQWQSALDQLPDRVALEAIGSFATVVREMLRLQWEELRIKKRVEAYQRDLEKRELSYQNASMRESHTMMPPHPVPRSPTTTTSGSDNEAFDLALRDPGRDGFTERSEVSERRVRMEVARRKLEEEHEEERKAYTDTRAYTLIHMQAGLPQLFQAIIIFSNAEAEIYDRLNSTGGSIGKHINSTHK